MKITFLGAGYVGLTSGAVFANFGNKVWVVRRNKNKVNMMKEGNVPFYEPDLDDLVAKNVKAKRLIPTTSYEESVPNSDIIFISVGTPIGEKGEADLSQVKSAAKKLAPLLNNKYTVIVDKSTVPPGTARRVTRIIEKENPKANFEVASCPEFLREGTALSDTQNPDRIVIGTKTNKARTVLEELHKPLNSKIIHTSIESAEIIKYAANAYLALRIGFIDQIANLCEKVGADVKDVVEGIGADTRIGSHYWYPGIGYGGYCFPKDVAALAQLFEQHVAKDNLFSKLDQYNRERPAKYAKKLATALNNPKQKQIAILGLTAKPGTDDMRGSQAIPFINALQKQGAKIKAYDPMGMPEAKKLLANVFYAKNTYQAVKDCDAVAVLCEWNEFKNLDWSKVKKQMNSNIILDAKRIFDPQQLEELGFLYIGTGI